MPTSHGLSGEETRQQLQITDTTGRFLEGDLRAVLDVVETRLHGKTRGAVRLGSNVNSHKIEFTHRPASCAPPGAPPAPVSDQEERPHRIARVLALAHKLDELVRSGEVADHGELARLGHVSPARICQYMTLLHPAPAIQEYLLFLAVSQASPISEAGLRRIAREPRWDRQRALFDSLLARK